MARRQAHSAISKPVAAPEIEPAKAPSWLRPVVLVLAGLLLLGWFSTASSDSDTWWMLKGGQYIAQTHKLPLPDPFSFTTYLGNATPQQAALREYNLRFEWLAELIMYGIYAIAGFPGIVL